MIKGNTVTQSHSYNSPVANEKTPNTSAEDVFVFPTSFAQQRLWFLDQLEPDSPLYNVPVAFCLTGPLNVTALEQSLNEIVRRHEALRTTFELVEGQPMQVIAPTQPLTLTAVSLRNLPETERAAEARRRITFEALRVFDLECGPLLRATLLQIDDEKHVLLIVMHHIVSDGWSMEVLFREVSLLYEAFSIGKPSPLPSLPIQYADFAVWQRQWLSGETLSSQLAYWEKQLDGAPAILELPTDRPRPAVQTFRGASQTFLLPQQLTEALKALSQREGVTLFMTLLATFKTLLCRYTGTDDIVVGSSIANRNRAEIEGLIGVFVNTLVLRTDISGNPTFLELLGRVREVALGAYAHQDLPFEKLISELQPKRDLSRSPLFQVMFILQNAPRQHLELPNLTVNRLEIEGETAKFDVTLFMTEEVEGLSGVLEYNTDLFDDATIKRMTGHFQTLFAGIVAHPEQHLSDLPLLTEAERHQLLVEWNATEAEYPKNVCLHHLFEAQVERTPSAVAVVCEEKQLTYWELNRQANQLAHYLQQLGAGPEVRIGLCVERSPDMVVALLGILKAGSAYVPLDPTYPEERLAFILQDAQVPVLLTQQTLLDRLSSSEAQVVCTDTDWPDIASYASDNPVSEVMAGHLAYVIYTSGSTGRPKGVMIPHRSLVNYVIWCTRTYPVMAGHGAPVHSPVAFDLTVTSLLVPLMVGQPVTLIPEALGAEGLSTALREHPGYSLVKLTPAHLDLLSQQVPEETAADTTKAFIIGGEALMPEHIAFWRQTAPDTLLINEYGPTETVVGCCVYQVPAAELVSGSIPIGRPIANTQLYILDEKLQPVPVGVTGELYIGGAGVAQGYLNRPELTEERFIPHPFSTDPGARLYKTGDWASYRADGNLEFLGRVDNQVKIRGYRIEPGEIEAVLGQHPAVQNVVVLAREETQGDKRLVAYVVSQPETAVEISDLRGFLQQKLPDYMVPSAFVFLEALPLTPNGKVDRRALPAPTFTRPDPEETFVPPRDDIERQLTHIWQDVLGVEPIGVRDNFFDLGGHSLLAVRLFAHIAKVFNHHLPLAALFATPTIEQLANRLRQQDEEISPWYSLVPMQPNGSHPPLFSIHSTRFHTLARYLGPEQPLYALRYGLASRTSADALTLPSRLEELATHYIDELRTFQPQGPYYLMGLCMGSRIAFEMAQQLVAQGEEVALLAMFDPVIAAGVQPLPLRTRVSSLRQIGLSEVLKRLRGKVHNRLRRLRSEKSPLAKEKYRNKYVPQVYAGKAVLFVPTNRTSLSWSFDAKLGWDNLIAGGLEIHEVPGHHTDIFQEPHVRVMAETFKACLDQAQKEA